MGLRNQGVHWILDAKPRVSRFTCRLGVKLLGFRGSGLRTSDLASVTLEVLQIVRSTARRRCYIENHRNFGGQLPPPPMQGVTIGGLVPGYMSREQDGP